MSKTIQNRYKIRSFLLFLILIFSSTIPLYFHFNSVLGQPPVNGNTNTLITSSPSLNPPVIVDPNPKLIDNKSGSLINDINLASTDHNKRNGTIADGVSKLLLIISYKNPLNFSIVNDNTNFSKGTLSILSDSFNNSILFTKNSSVIVKPLPTASGTPLAVAVYAPPSYPTSTTISSNKTNGTVKILVHDVTNPSLNSEVPISLYRVPVVLVHGIWSNPQQSWANTKFNETLKNFGNNVSFANYSKYNAETFDPILIGNKGNYGIDSIRNITKETLQKYHDKGIAASQVDVVAHSMGGLMARGFIQQEDYKNSNNSMHGYIHRLITVGTPHYGGGLAKFLIDNENNTYCVSSFPPYVFSKLACGLLQNR